MEGKTKGKGSGAQLWSKNAFSCLSHLSFILQEPFSRCREGKTNPFLLSSLFPSTERLVFGPVEGREDKKGLVFPILVPGEPEIKGPEGPEQVLLRREQP